MDLTPRERLVRALNFESVEMIPATGPYGWHFLDDPSVDKTAAATLRDEMRINPPGVAIFIFETGMFRDGKDEWGVVWKGGHDIHNPVADWDDLMSYEFPKAADRGLFPSEAIKQCQRKGDQVILGSAWQMTTFERYRSLRGFENALLDPFLFPDRCFDLVQRILEYNLRAIETWVGLGCDIIGFADDLGSQTGMLVDPDTWRTFYKPAYRQMCEAIHNGGAKTWMHTDGAMSAIIPDLAEVGLDILDPVQAECIDVGEFTRQYKNKVVIWGGLNSHLIGTGTRETIREHVQDMVRVVDGMSGGMVGTTSNYLFSTPEAAIGLFQGFRNGS